MRVRMVAVAVLVMGCHGSSSDGEVPDGSHSQESVSEAGVDDTDASARDADVVRIDATTPTQPAHDGGRADAGTPQILITHGPHATVPHSAEPIVNGATLTVTGDAASGLGTRSYSVDVTGVLPISHGAEYESFQASSGNINIARTDREGTPPMFIIWNIFVPSPIDDDLQPFSITHPDGAPLDATLSAEYFFDGADYRCDGSGPWSFEVSAVTAWWNLGQSSHAYAIHGTGHAVCTYAGGQTADGHFGPTDASKVGSTVTVGLRF